MFYRKYEEPFENNEVVNEGMQLDSKKILIGVIGFVMIVMAIIGGLFWLNDDKEDDYGSKWDEMRVYAQQREFDGEESCDQDESDMRAEQKPVYVEKHQNFNYYSSYDDYNYDYSDYNDYTYDYSCEDYNYDYSSKEENHYENAAPVDGLEDLPDFLFSSGAGGWGTVVTINPDGTFTGEYSDSEMGVTGSGYPNGTCYISTFSGKFTDIEKVDEHTYSLRLESIETDEEEGEEWIEDGVKYIAAEPYGFEDGEVFYLYMPGTENGTLPEGFVSWMQCLDPCGEQGEILTTYGLYNAEMEYGFVEWVEW